jgi:acetyltransferase-like isoleucine patch superfamily enzyme
MVIKKLVWYLRFLKYKNNKKISMNGIPIFNSRVNIILGKNAKLDIGEKVVFKQNTSILVKDNACLQIGSRTSTGHNTEISCGESIQIGRDVIMGAYTYISDSNHQYSNKDIPIKDQGMFTEPVIIEDDIWIGRNAQVLSNSIIKNRTIVAAGCVVKGKFERGVILGGIPAKVIKEI